MEFENLTIKEAQEIIEKASKLSEFLGKPKLKNECEDNQAHPMLGRRCLVRTYSAGVHIGDVDYINLRNSMEIRLLNSIRLWKWEGGGLSLSDVANNGIKGGRLSKTGEVYLTNAIELIPTTEEAEETYVRFIED